MKTTDLKQWRSCLIPMGLLAMSTYMSLRKWNHSQFIQCEHSEKKTRQTRTAVACPLRFYWPHPFAFLKQLQICFFVYQMESAGIGGFSQTATKIMKILLQRCNTCPAPTPTTPQGGGVVSTL